MPQMKTIAIAFKKLFIYFVIISGGVMFVLMLVYWESIHSFWKKFHFVDEKYSKCMALREGMLEKEVISVMGEPDVVGFWDRGKLKNKKYLIYFDKSFGSSGDNEVFVDTDTLKVIRLVCGGEER